MNFLLIPDESRIGVNSRISTVKLLLANIMREGVGEVKDFSAIESRKDLEGGDQRLGGSELDFEIFEKWMWYAVETGWGAKLFRRGEWREV